MSIYTCARDVLEYFDKNGTICGILSVPKYVIINLKINNFKDNKSTTTKQSVRNIFLQYQSRCACQYINKYMYMLQEGGGGPGASPLEAE